MKDEISACRKVVGLGGVAWTTGKLQGKMTFLYVVLLKDSSFSSGIHISCYPLMQEIWLFA